MKIKDMTKEELELLSNCDIAALLLKENKKPMNTPKIFRNICDLLGYSDSEYTDKIGEFYTALTTDKRFILLDTAEWDLRDNHSIKISIDDEEESDYEEEIEDEEEEIVEDEEVEEKDVEEPIDDEELDIDDDDDELEDLAIVDEEDIDA
ncbi:MAG TPA: DNA-directed RNA polymerase subunit delta [Bacilli bacterium]|nr:DNA-directed RNA polymerase subunit delta [Bacilli bacterium]